MTKPFRPLSAAKQNMRALLLGGALTTLCGVGVAATLANQDPPTDERSCLIGRPPPLVREVVIDTTTRLSPQETVNVLAAVREARDLPRFGQIVLLLVDADHPYEPKAYLNLCNPGSPSQLNVLFHTPSHAERRWIAAFGKPLDDIAETLTKSGDSATSPLLETITGVTWRPEFRAIPQGKFPPPKREIVLISDLRQYMPSQRLSFYEGAGPWAAFKRSPTAAAAEANLHNVTVSLEVLHRPQAGLSEAHVIGFWRAWLTSHGAARILIDGVEMPLAPGGEAHIAQKAGA